EHELVFGNVERFNFGDLAVDRFEPQPDQPIGAVACDRVEQAGSAGLRIGKALSARDKRDVLAPQAFAERQHLCLLGKLHILRKRQPPWVARRQRTHIDVDKTNQILALKARHWCISRNASCFDRPGILRLKSWLEKTTQGSAAAMKDVDGKVAFITAGAS